MLLIWWLQKCTINSFFDFSFVQRNEEFLDVSKNDAPNEPATYTRCGPEPTVYDELNPNRNSSVYIDPQDQSSYLNPTYIENEVDSSGNHSNYAIVD